MKLQKTFVVMLLAGTFLLSLPFSSTCFNARLLVKERLKESHRKLSLWHEGTRWLDGEGKTIFNKILII